MRRLSTFVLIFGALLLSVSTYIGLRLATRTEHWITLSLVAGMLLLFPLKFWLGNEEPSGKLRVLTQQVAYLCMGLTSWLLVVTFLRDLTLLLTWTTAGYESTMALAYVTDGWHAFLAASLLTLVGVVWAFRGLRLRKIEIIDKNLPALSIAQISDLHIGPTIGAGYVNRVVKMVNEQKADLVVLTGDILDGRVHDQLPVAQLLENLEPKGRVYFTPGNHEYYSQFPEWVPVLEKLGIRVLLNRGEMIEVRGNKIWVAGVTDPAAPKSESPNASQAMRGGEKADFRLLLSHRPELAESAANAGFHLQLSGHTHGGQFFPWTLVARWFHQYYLGLMKAEAMWIYVSPGTGTWGPPVRIGTTPEVSLLTLSAF